MLLHFEPFFDAGLKVFLVTMLSMMPLLSVYWPYLLSVILCYAVYVQIFGQGRKNSINENRKTVENRRVSKQIIENHFSSKDDADAFEEDEVVPLTFPEDTRHIPYIFNEISEVRRNDTLLLFSSIISYICNQCKYIITILLVK